MMKPVQGEKHKHVVVMILKVTMMMRKEEDSNNDSYSLMSCQGKQNDFVVDVDCKRHKAMVSYYYC